MSGVARIAWTAGADRLEGRCGCGATAEAAEPAALWDWLAAHPDHPVSGPEPLRDHPSVPPRHLVVRPAQAAGRRTPVVEARRAG